MQRSPPGLLLLEQTVSGPFILWLGQSVPALCTLLCTFSWESAGFASPPDGHRFSQFSRDSSTNPTTGLDRSQPDSPWPFCAAALLLIADGQVGAARFSLDLCSERCRESSCEALLARLRNESTERDQPIAKP